MHKGFSHEKSTPQSSDRRRIILPRSRKNISPDVPLFSSIFQRPRRHLTLTGMITPQMTVSLWKHQISLYASCTLRGRFGTALSPSASITPKLTSCVSNVLSDCSHSALPISSSKTFEIQRPHDLDALRVLLHFMQYPAGTAVLCSTPHYTLVPSVKSEE